jgi:hypothetical protein
MSCNEMFAVILGILLGCLIIFSVIFIISIAWIHYPMGIMKAYFAKRKGNKNDR